MNINGTKLLALGVLVAALAGCTGGKERQAEYYSRAQSFFAEGNFEKSRVELKNALQIDGDYPDGRYLMALLEEKDQNWQQMFANLNLTIDLDPNHIPARIKIGQMFYANKAYEQVIEHVEVVLALEPNNADAHMLKGSVKYRQGYYEEAIHEANLALKEQPGHVGAISILSEVYKAQDPDRALAIIGDGLLKQNKSSTLKLLKIDVLETQGRVDEAISVYRELIDNNPENLLFHYRLVKLFEKYNRVDEAEQQLRGMINARPDNVKLKLWLAQFIANRKDLTIAENALKDFLKRQPELVELRMALAKVYISQKRFDNAREVYTLLIQSNPESANALLARNKMVELELALGNEAPAEVLLDEIFALEPENSEALITRAKLALLKENTKTAISDLRTVVKNQSRPIDALLLLAKAHELSGAKKLALDNYRQVLSIDAREMRSLLGAAKIELAEQNLEVAEYLLSTAIDLSENNMEATRMLVELYSKQGRWDEGHAKAEGLLADDRSVALGHYLKGRLFLSQERYAEAVVELKNTLSVQPKVIDGLVALSDALIKLDRKPDALEYVKQHTQKYPDQAHAHELLGGLVGATDVNAGIASYRKAIDLNPSKVSAYINLSNLYSRAGKGQESLATLNEGIEVNPKAISLKILAAGQLQTNGLYVEAAQFYEKALEIRPDSLIAANNLAMIYADHMATEENLQKALKLSRKLSAQRDPIFLDTVGWVNVKVGNYPSAINYLKSALDAGGEGVDLHYHLAKAYLGDGQIEKAKKELEIVLADPNEFEYVADAKQMFENL